MTTLAAFFTDRAGAEASARTAPEKPRTAGPLLMCDITTQCGGVPLLLHLWRAEEDAVGSGPAER